MYILIIISLLCAAFFSSIEVAYASANRLRIEIDKKQYQHYSGIIDIFLQNPSRFYATVNVGNVLSACLLTYATCELYDRCFNYTGGIYTQVFSVFGVAAGAYILIGVLFPRLFAQHENVNLLRLFSVPMLVFYYLFFPIYKLLFLIAKMLVNMFSRKCVKTNKAEYWGMVDWEELADNNQQAATDEPSNDIKILQNALDFSNVKVRECMVPRPEIVGISANDSIDNLRRKFIESGLSKIIVYGADIDHVVGFAPSISLFHKPTNISAITRELPIVPETMTANRLLTLFIQNHRSIALVVDEFGGTSGIVTMEDILEEIVGDIQDEYDKKRYRETKLSDNHFQFSARLEIDYINEKYDLNLPTSDEYETIAGLILAHYGNIPKTKDVINIKGFKLTILRASSTKIELVDVVRVDEE